jgi:uncharacterized lipoprotein YddW (UPF0748 family)
MVASTPRFNDVQNHWAQPFIEALAARGFVRGFQDGSFRPNRVVNRAEYAALIQPALNRPSLRPYVPFVDVPANHWAIAAIRAAFEAGFVSGYPGQQFRPDATISRTEVFVSLVGGLGWKATGRLDLSSLYQDHAAIPSWATPAVAAATEAGIVVNYPTLSLLRSPQPATRAEVAATLYQCLVNLGRAPDIAAHTIAANAIVRSRRTVAVSHTREFRAAWISTVWNIDWTSKPGIPTAQQQSELTALLDQLQAMKFNAVILQVRPEGDAFYTSTIEPWSHWLTGTQGQAPNPAYDPLEFAIAQCRQRNLEFHAWFNPYRARTSDRTINAPNHLATTQPQVVYPWGRQLWMDPGAKAVQDRTYAVILDVVRRYDLDGVHLDDYFYPYPIAGQPFPDDKTYQSYRASGGPLALADWRRENVNQMVQRLSTGIRATKPHVKFGISPFGIYRPGQPAGVRGLDAYNELYADALKWVQEGWVDYLAPQLYWKIDAPGQSYPALMNWWAANTPPNRHLYIGNNLSQLDGKAWELGEIEQQINLTRQARSQRVLGNIFFSMDALATNRQGIRDRFQTATYASPALPPPMPWLRTTAPQPPLNVQVQSQRLSWTAANTETRAWSLYRQETGPQNTSQWVLQQILPATTTVATVATGSYALCAVNRLGSESVGVLVTV